MFEERVNFLWVGPPRTSLGAAPLGSDIKDVVAMAQKIKNPIYFYCQEEHAKTYTDIFKGLGIKNVSVKSIDKHLDKIAEGKSDLKPQAIQLNKMKAELLAPPRDRIIDRVSFKDAFSLFLLASRGGYNMDASVKIDSPKKVEFPKYGRFKCPTDETTPETTPEVWMMYSPRKKPLVVTTMLDHYLSNYDNVQKIIRGNQKDPEKIYDYHKKITWLMVNSVLTGLSLFSEADNSWSYNVDRSDKTARILGVPIIKQYGNTHKPWIEVQKIIEADFQLFQKTRKGHVAESKLIGIIGELIKKAGETNENNEQLQILIHDTLKFMKTLDKIEALRPPVEEIRLPSGTGEEGALEVGDDKISMTLATSIGNAYQELHKFLVVIDAKAGLNKLPSYTEVDELAEIVQKADRELSTVVEPLVDLVGDSKEAIFKAFKQRFEKLENEETDETTTNEASAGGSYQGP